MTTPAPPPFAAWVGIDWADDEHAVWITDARSGESQSPSLPQEAGAIDQWASDLQQRFEGRIAVCLEQSKGALIYALMKYDHLVLYPINPKQLARYREAVAPSGAKDDPTDAQLLAEFLEHCHERLRPWEPDDQTTRLITILNEDRRDLVHLRTRLTNRLQDRLKLYFPLVLQLFRPRPLHAEVLCEFLLRWGSLAELHKAEAHEIEAFLRVYRLHDKAIAEILAQIDQAVPLSTDEAILTSGRLHAQALAGQVLELNRSIAQCDVKLKELMEQHPDAELFTGLPGAGDALAPRLLAAFGTDRQRHQSAEDLQCYSGIAPVLRRSGRTTFITQRWACPRFLKQTFHEFARCSIAKSTWAKAYYRMQRERGKKHHAAIRALAFKWIRVIYACWKSSTPYNEYEYMQRLRRAGAPLLAYLPTQQD